MDNGNNTDTEKKNPRRMSADEMETHIHISRKEQDCKIWTSDPVWMRKLDKLTASDPENYHLWYEEKVDGETVANSYTGKKKLVRLAKQRIMTEEQRDALSIRLSESRKNKKGGYHAQTEC